MRYPKIDTLWKRDKDNKFQIMEGHYSKDEFEAIDRWLVTEKIDGTSVRALLLYNKVTIGGRNHIEGDPKFGMEKELVKHVKEIFNDDVILNHFPNVVMTFFGEGYGANIQKGGGLYRKDVGFILFDVVVHGEDYEWWLKRDDVVDIAEKLGIPVVPELGVWTKDRIQRFIQNKEVCTSIVSKEPKLMEGIIATSYPLMLFRNGKPIKFKLKVKDYE